MTEWSIVRHWKCRVRVKLHRGFESLPLRFLCNQLDLRHQVYKVSHLDETRPGAAPLAGMEVFPIQTEGDENPEH